MLAIKRLFHRDSDFLTFKAITEEPIPDIRDRRPDIPPGMRAALIQAMARDPNGRFETAQAFANALRNSVATIGGPASENDLARLLFTDFGDEMAARDEILKAADEPAPNPPPPKGHSQVVQMPSRPTTMPPPLPPAARSGELGASANTNRRPPTGPVEVVPSMIVQAPGTGPGTSPGTGRMDLLTPPTPATPAGVIDLSEKVSPVDTWMANPDTDLLRGHRMRGIRNVVIGIVILGALVAGGVFFLQRGSGDSNPVTTNVPPDAAVKHLPVAAPDAGISKDDIYAISRFGYITITANQKTTIYVDGKNIGETPMTRLPLAPGPKKIKAIGPKKNQKKEFSTVILGGQDAEPIDIEW
jgi:hypothetical protein